MQLMEQKLADILGELNSIIFSGDLQPSVKSSLMNFRIQLLDLVRMIQDQEKEKGGKP